MRQTAEPPSPVALAERMAALSRPLLLGLDVDGTLAPIVARPPQALLADGVAHVLARLVVVPDLVVAVVSGRAARELREQFGFPPGVLLVGSHGIEDDDGGVALDADELERLAAIARIAGAAAARAPGAWVEAKPAGVALHTRAATPGAGAEARQWLVERAERVDHVHVLPGHEVVDVSVRRLSKSVALRRLGERVETRAICYLGDDTTDEEVFAALGPGDLGVRVGPGPTAASGRVDGPADVVVLLEAFAGLVG